MSHQNLVKESFDSSSSNSRMNTEIIYKYSDILFQDSFLNFTIDFKSVILILLVISVES